MKKQKYKQYKKAKKLLNRRKDQTLHALRGFSATLKASTRRIDVLRKWAAIVLPCADDQGGYEAAKLAAVESRAAWHCENKHALFVVGCGRKAEHAHHVIQIQHGGADILRNKVPVCDVCHADIHPWMPVPVCPDALRPLWA